jgi:predicted ArsR family transcriptional regulator
LLDVLRTTGRPMGTAELADMLGLHPNSVREQITRLVKAGLVEQTAAAPVGRGRPALRYAAHPDPSEPDSYEVLARVLAEQLGRAPDAAAMAEAAGERWGRSLVGAADRVTTPRAAMDRLIRVLDVAGFAPEVPTPTSESISLRRCPFETLAHTDTTVVCGVHLGLMRGVLAASGAPVETVTLQPFVEPGRCLAHVASIQHA